MVNNKHFGALAVVARALVAVALLMLVLVLANARSAEAAFPGTSGKIAYGAGGAINTINPNGTGLLSPVPCIPSNHAFCNVTHRSNPSYSPDGKRIAYEASDGQDYEIFTIPASGGADQWRRQVTFNTAFDSNPSYNPRTNEIAYYSNASGGDDEIYRISASGGTPVQVTNNNRGDRFPDYSPDGSRIVYSCSDATFPAGGDYEICEVYLPTGQTSGGTTVQVTNNSRNDFSPVYSPSSTGAGYGIAFDAWDGQDYEIFMTNRTWWGGWWESKVTNNTTTDYAPSWQPIP